MSERTLNLIKDNDARWVDLRFTDTIGKEQHVTIPAADVDEDTFEQGKMFDGSSIAGWKGINESDMILMPDDETSSSLLDPFTDDDATVIIALRRHRAGQPCRATSATLRSVAKRAEEPTSTSTGLGDTAFFGPEPEFFVFDDVKWHADMSGAGYTINSEEAAWSSSHHYDDGNTGHRPPGERRVFSCTTRGLSARYPRCDVFRHGANGFANRGTPPRSRNRRTMRNRRSLQHAGEKSRRSPDSEVLCSQRRARLWQDRYLYAKTTRG